MLLLLLGSNVAIAAENQSLTLTYTGVIVDIGSQHYRSRGGSFVSASVTVAGTTLSLTSAHLVYSIEAEVRGNDVSGHAVLDLRGQDDNFGVVSLTGGVNLTGSRITNYRPEQPPGLPPQRLHQSDTGFPGGSC